MNIILFLDEIDNVSIDGNCTNPFNYDHFDSAYEIARAQDTNVNPKSLSGSFIYIYRSGSSSFTRKSSGSSKIATSTGE